MGKMSRLNIEHEARGEYYQNNKEKMKAASKEYRANNREKVNKYHRKYRSENIEQMNKYHKEYERKRRAAIPWEKHFKNAKQRCTNPNNTGFHRYGGRGIRFLLSMNDIEYLYVRDEACNMERPSIDRIDNDSDYVFMNCRFIEMVENSKLGSVVRWGNGRGRK